MLHGKQRSKSYTELTLRSNGWKIIPLSSGECQRWLEGRGDFQICTPWCTSGYVCKLCENKAHLEILLALSFEWSPGQERFWAELSLDSAQNTLWSAVVFQFLTWAILWVILIPWSPNSDPLKSLLKSVKCIVQSMQDASASPGELKTIHTDAWALSQDFRLSGPGWSPDVCILWKQSRWFG